MRISIKEDKRAYQNSRSPKEVEKHSYNNFLFLLQNFEWKIYVSFSLIVNETGILR